MRGTVWCDTDRNRLEKFCFKAIFVLPFQALLPEKETAIQAGDFFQIRQ